MICAMEFLGGSTVHFLLRYRERSGGSCRDEIQDNVCGSIAGVELRQNMHQQSDISAPPLILCTGKRKRPRRSLRLVEAVCGTR